MWMPCSIISLSSLFNKHSESYVYCPATVNEVAEVSCVYYKEGHLFDNCHGNPASVNYVGNYNRQNNHYSNTYNFGRRQHPNLSWESQHQNQHAIVHNGQNRPAQPPGFHQQIQGQKNTNNDKINSLEALLKSTL